MRKSMTAEHNMTLTINWLSPPANLLVMWYNGSSGLAWQGGTQYFSRFSSRYQLLVSSKVWKRRENSWMSGCVCWRVRRVPGLQITSGPIRPEWRSFSWNINKEIGTCFITKADDCSINLTKMKCLWLLLDFFFILCLHFWRIKKTNKKTNHQQQHKKIK